MGKAKTQTERLIDVLEENISGGIIRPGEWNLTLGSSDLVIELQVKVRRKVAPTAASDYIAAALASLEARSYHDGACNHHTVKKRSYPHSTSCSKAIGWVVVTRDVWAPAGQEKQLRFQFVCATHADMRKIDPQVLGVFLLPKRRLVEIRRLHDLRDAARIAQRQAEEKGAGGVCAWLMALASACSESRTEVATDGGR